MGELGQHKSRSVSPADLVAWVAGSVTASDVVIRPDGETVDYFRISSRVESEGDSQCLIRMVPVPVFVDSPESDKWECTVWAIPYSEGQDREMSRFALTIVAATEPPVMRECISVVDYEDEVKPWQIFQQVGNMLEDPRLPTAVV